MREPFITLLNIILEINGQSLIIAIDGRCGAGKTTLAYKLQETLNCNVIHMDQFFLQPSQRSQKRLAEPGGNVDYERVRKEVLVPASEGKEIIYQPYNCKKKQLEPFIHMKAHKITIIEGSYSCHPTLWDFYHLRIFLDVLPEEQLLRIERRNGSKALTQFRECWIPLEEYYFTYYHIQERCDLRF